MKRIWIVLTLVLAAALLAGTMTVFATPAPSVDVKKTPPGKATDVQIDNNFVIHGNGHENGNGQNQKNNHANKKLEKKTAVYFGVISSVAADSLTITLADDTSLTFQIPTGVSVKIPTMGKSVSTANLVIDQNVRVRAYTDENKNLIAISIQVVPGKPVAIQRVGLVSAYEPGASITIQAADGQMYAFILTANTKILPAERAAELTLGTRVTIICPRDVTGGPLTAAGIVVHPINPAWGGTPTPTLPPTETPTPTIP